MNPSKKKGTALHAPACLTVSEMAILLRAAGWGDPINYELEQVAST